MKEKFGCDTTMRKLWLCLARDFATSGTGDIFETFSQRFLEDPLFPRKYTWPDKRSLSVPLFKRVYQLEMLFKRYRFEKDVYSDSEIREQSIKKFMDTQTRISVPLPLRQSDRLVLREARKICTSILGDYSETELHDICRFGKRACVGIPFRDSYLHVKLSRALTGTQPHIDWFKSHLATDNLLGCFIAGASQNGSIQYEMCDTLPLFLVPKSYKALRIIKPPTLLGSYYTQGIGRLISKRLKDAGLDISRLQEQHKRYVVQSSKDRRLVTADLSSASDSISKELLMRLLPRRWYRAIMCGRTPFVTIEGERVLLQSTLTMGDGDTFPIQTLVFYSLLRAIGNLTNEKTFVSVYGDDLIYSRKIHKFVSGTFPRLHLLLNEDKTNVETFFRESCGSDCYRGVDVRPFNPEGSHHAIDRSFYLQFIYKLYNGLILRWDPAEIPTTLEMLLNELILYGDGVYQVPPSFPDSSGLKVNRPKTDWFFKPVTYNQNLSFSFKYLKNSVILKKIKKIGVGFYFWDTLRVNTQGADEFHFELDVSLPILKYKSIKLKDRKEKIQVACVVRKGSTSIVEQTGLCPSWT